MNGNTEENDLVEILLSLTSDGRELNSFLDTLDIDRLTKLAAAASQLYEAAAVRLL
jgi:hypothetical protein